MFNRSTSEPISTTLNIDTTSEDLSSSTSIGTELPKNPLDGMDLDEIATVID